MKEVSWKETLGLSGRTAPELIESVEQIQELPYAHEIEKVMRDFSVSGIFCVQNIPQVIIMSMRDYDIGEIRTVHKAMWNQGLARLLVVVSPELVRVFSISRSLETESSKEFEERFLFESIAAVGKASEIERIFYGVESGRLWNADQFDPKELIDQVLLKNLNVAHEKLLKEGLSKNQAQAALIQTMFIAYLEDRGIINENYMNETTENKFQTHIKLVESGDFESYKNLFRQLKADFNGDLFVSPCTFSSSENSAELSPEILNLPFPSPEEFPDGMKSKLRKIERRVISIVDSELEKHSRGKKNPGAETGKPKPIGEILKSIDILIYEYFGLSESEIVLIEDTVEHVLGAMQSTPNSKANYWRDCNKQARKKYAGQLIKSLSECLRSGDNGINAELIAHNEDFGIVRLKICRKSTLKPYVERNEHGIGHVLEKISKIVENFGVRNFQSIPDFRIFAGNSLYLIKPMQQRFWLKSVAIEDANKIFLEINEFALQQRMEGYNEG